VNCVAARCFVGSYGTCFCQQVQSTRQNANRVSVLVAAVFRSLVDGLLGRASASPGGDHSGWTVNTLWPSNVTSCVGWVPVPLESTWLPSSM
jgi:hypothetical protein